MQGVEVCFSRAGEKHTVCAKVQEKVWLTLAKDKYARLRRCASEISCWMCCSRHTCYLPSSSPSINKRSYSHSFLLFPPSCSDGIQIQNRLHSTSQYQEHAIMGWDEMWGTSEEQHCWSFCSGRRCGGWQKTPDSRAFTWTQTGPEL